MILPNRTPQSNAIHIRSSRIFNLSARANIIFPFLGENSSGCLSSPDFGEFFPRFGVTIRLFLFLLGLNMKASYFGHVRTADRSGCRRPAPVSNPGEEISMDGCAKFAEKTENRRIISYNAFYRSM